MVGRGNHRPHPGGRSDLKHDTGKDVFFDKLLKLKHLSLPAKAFYADLLAQVFTPRPRAGLHLANLRDAPGEIGVRTATATPISP